MSFFRQKTSNDLVPMRQRGILFDVSWQPGWIRLIFLLPEIY